MKKVVRLTEKDVEKLVRKIIKEEKEPVNENPIKWLRKKFNSDEEVGLSILKGVEEGEATDITSTWQEVPGHDEYEFNLGEHRVIVIHAWIMRTSYHLRVDGESLEVSDTTAKRIFNIIDKKHRKPADDLKRTKLNDLKTSLSRYNLPKNERERLNNTNTFFGELD